MTLTTGELARVCGAELVAGDPSQAIAAAASIDDAGADQLSFISSVEAVGKLGATRAGAVIIPRALLPVSAVRASLGLLASDDPEIAFIHCLKRLYPDAVRETGVSGQAWVHPSAQIGADSFVAAGASIGAGARIGRGCTIQAGCSVGAQVEIGDGCTLHPNVVLYSGTVLRENVTIHAGSVIGADGFGYKHRQGVHIKFPQVGTVLIERDVEIGANTCIDRAALGQTVIGAGSKLDNQVHIAHNVQIGKGVLICGQTGIGGSTVIEDYVTLASQSGIADHVRVGSRAVVLAKSGVIGNITPGAQVMGFPATERRVALKEMAALSRVAELHRPLKALVDLLPALQKLVKPSS